MKVSDQQYLQGKSLGEIQYQFGSTVKNLCFYWELDTVSSSSLYWLRHSTSYMNR
jgi:hypothetical protein